MPAMLVGFLVRKELSAYVEFEMRDVEASGSWRWKKTWTVLETSFDPCEVFDSIVNPGRMWGLV